MPSSKKHQSDNKFTIHRLHHVHKVLRNFQKENVNKLIEHLRELAEILLWAEKKDLSMMDYFYEKNVLRDLITVRKHSNPAVHVQLIQTVNMLIYNASQPTTVFYLLSGNHINKLIAHPYDFENEEVVSAYVSFLKSLSVNLSKYTIQFFVEVGKDRAISIPLYGKAVELFNSSDHMVRIAVRTIALKVYEHADQTALDWILYGGTSYCTFFKGLCKHIQRECIKLDRMLRPYHTTLYGEKGEGNNTNRSSSGSLTSGRPKTPLTPLRTPRSDTTSQPDKNLSFQLVGYQCQDVIDIVLFFNDIISIGREALTQALGDNILRLVMFLIHNFSNGIQNNCALSTGLDPGDSTSSLDDDPVLHTTVAGYLLSQVVLNITDPKLLTRIVLLTLEPPPPIAIANDFVEEPIQDSEQLDNSNCPFTNEASSGIVTSSLTSMSTLSSLPRSSEEASSNGLSGGMVTSSLQSAGTPPIAVNGSHLSTPSSSMDNISSIRHSQLSQHSTSSDNTLKIPIIQTTTNPSFTIEDHPKHGSTAFDTSFDLHVPQQTHVTKNIDIARPKSTTQLSPILGLQHLSPQQSHHAGGASPTPTLPTVPCSPQYGNTSTNIQNCPIIQGLVSGSATVPTVCMTILLCILSNSSVPKSTLSKLKATKEEDGATTTTVATQSPKQSSGSEGSPSPPPASVASTYNYNGQYVSHIIGSTIVVLYGYIHNAAFTRLNSLACLLHLMEELTGVASWDSLMTHHTRLLTECYTIARDTLLQRLDMLVDYHNMQIEKQQDSNPQTQPFNGDNIASLEMLSFFQRQYKEFQQRLIGGKRDGLLTDTTVLLPQMPFQYPLDTDSYTKMKVSNDAEIINQPSQTPPKPVATQKGCSDCMPSWITKLALKQRLPQTEAELLVCEVHLYFACRYLMFRLLGKQDSYCQQLTYVDINQNVADLQGKIQQDPDHIDVLCSVSIQSSNVATRPSLNRSGTSAEKTTENSADTLDTSELVDCNITVLPNFYRMVVTYGDQPGQVVSVFNCDIIASSSNPKRLYIRRDNRKNTNDNYITLLFDSAGDKESAQTKLQEATKRSVRQGTQVVRRMLEDMSWLPGDVEQEVK